jgi:hypothetical protein
VAVPPGQLDFRRRHGGGAGLSLAVTNFSLELTGLAIAVGYVGLYAGFAHANAVSPKRRDPQVMFVLGGTAQIVLITAVMTPLTYVAASANLPMQDANLLAIDRASTAAIISSTSSPAPRSPCWLSSPRAAPDGSLPGGKFALRTARWFLSRSRRNKAQRIAANAGRASAKARRTIKPMTIATAARPTLVFT